jgi:uncharacterized membrane protein
LSDARLAHLVRLGIGVAASLPWLMWLAGLGESWLPLFQGVCHQRPERSLHWDGVQMLVCSRCAGLYLGVALGALVPLASRLRAQGRFLFFATGGLMLVEVVVQDLGLHAPWHPTRLLSGLSFGYVAAAWPVAELTRPGTDPLAPPPRTPSPGAPTPAPPAGSPPTR